MGDTHNYGTCLNQSSQSLLTWKCKWSKLLIKYKDRTREIQYPWRDNLLRLTAWCNSSPCRGDAHPPSLWEGLCLPAGHPHSGHHWNCPTNSYPDSCSFVTTFCLLRFSFIAQLHFKLVATHGLFGIGHSLGYSFSMESREPPCTALDHSEGALSLGNGELLKSQLQKMHSSKSRWFGPCHFHEDCIKCVHCFR